MDVEFKCPSCGLMCHAADGGAVRGLDGKLISEPTIVHKILTCAEYDAIETVDDGVVFMRRARERATTN